eukprot:6201244-Pleurochrysis_carterae.AAC.1
MRSDHLLRQRVRKDCRNLTLEAIRCAVGRGAQPCEALHLCTCASRRLLLLPVEVHDARLPLLVRVAL